MTVPSIKAPETLDFTLVKLAREIAMSIDPIEVILARAKMSQEQLGVIQQNPWFQNILNAEIQAWNSAINTQERTRLKTAVLVEQFLPEAHSLLHDRAESLHAKVNLANLMARIAGMGLQNADITETGSKFSVTINLGADKAITFEKNVTPQVIEAETLPNGS